MPSFDREENPPPLAGEGADGAVPEVLLGSWSATRWEYTDARDDAQRVDLVCDLGGMVTMSISRESWVLTFVVPGRGTSSTSGTLAAEDRMLRLSPTGQEPTTLGYRVSAEALSWNDADSGWDFDGDGRHEPARLVAVFVRI